MGKRYTIRITLTLAASLLVHGLVIALWPVQPETVNLSSGNSLTVSLLVRPAAPAPTTPVTTTASPFTVPTSKQVLETHTPVPEAKTVPPSTALVPSRPATDSAGQGETVSVSSATAVSAEARQQEVASNNSRTIKLHLQDAFQNYFYYPRMAIRRGWYGEVQLGLRIEANGTLTRIRVLQGSGHSLLDNAAIQSLARVQALPAAVSLLNGRSLDVVLPVEYRLL